MRLFILIAVALAQASVAAPRTMRLDYYHTGDVDEEYFSVDRIVVGAVVGRVVGETHRSSELDVEGSGVVRVGSDDRATFEGSIRVLVFVRVNEPAVRRYYVHRHEVVYREPKPASQPAMPPNRLS